LPLDFGPANGRFSASRPLSGRVWVNDRCPPSPDLQVRVLIVKFYPLDRECGPLFPWRTQRPCIARRAEIGLDLQKHREYGVAQSYPLRSYSLLRSTANRGRKTVRLLRRSIGDRENGFASARSLLLNEFHPKGRAPCGRPFNGRKLRSDFTAIFPSRRLRGSSVRVSAPTPLGSQPINS